MPIQPTPRNKKKREKERGGKGEEEQQQQQHKKECTRMNGLFPRTKKHTPMPPPPFAKTQTCWPAKKQ